MSLEDAMNNLASAMNRYADVIEKHGSTTLLKAVGDSATASTSDASKSAEGTAVKGKGGRPKKDEPKPDAGDDDGFGGGGSASSVPDKITADQMKAKLLEVRDAHGDKQPALDIIGKYGYAAIPDIKAADYKKIWADCDESIANA